jgi:hypothetical protein
LGHFVGEFRDPHFLLVAGELIRRQISLKRSAKARVVERW